MTETENRFTSGVEDRQTDDRIHRIKICVEEGLFVDSRRHKVAK